MPLTSIKTREMQGGLLVGLLTWGRGKKKGPYSHEPGTFEFYE